MAILGVPFKLNAADVGASNLMPAIMQGMQLGFAPRKMAQELLSAKLQNEINASKAKYAEPNAQAALAYSRAGTQHLGAQNQYLAQQTAALQRESDLYNKLLGGHLSAEDLQNNPIAAGLLKHKYGIDINARSPEQKMQIAIDQAMAIDAAKENMKKIEEGKETAAALLPYAKDISTLEQLHEDYPGLTGRGTAFLNNLGLKSNEALGKYSSAAQHLQSKMAHELGARGGFGVANIVSSAKPGIEKHEEFNKGAISHLKELMQDSFKQLQQDYKSRSGKDLPYSLKDIFKDIDINAAAQELGVHPEDIEHTAKVNKISVNKVIEMLKKKGKMHAS